MHHRQHVVTAFNTLLDAELSAVETYDQAMDLVDDEKERALLKGILQDHLQAVRLLEQQLEQLGATNDASGRVWPSFGEAVQGQRQLAVNPRAVQALKAGEECEVLTYEQALLDPDLPTDCRDLIHSILLPQTRGHRALLDGILLDPALAGGADNGSYRDNTSVLCQ